MMQIVDAFKSPSRPVDPAAAPSTRATLLREVFATFDRFNITYCVSHGYTNLPDVVESDVDLIVAPQQMPAVRSALASLAGGARLLQWMDDGAVWAVVEAAGEPGHPAIIQLHLSRSFEMGGRVFYTADQVLACRRRRGEFWIPSAEMEFALVCINRAIKKKFRPDHLAQLANLSLQNPAGCEREVSRFFPTTARKLLAAARSVDPSLLPQPLPAPVAPAALNAAHSRLSRFAGRSMRRAVRWARPRNGIHLVFLGPDGVGKSTVIDAIRDAALPAFLRTDYQTFAPSLIPGPLQPKKETPHQLPPRSYPASLVKAAWWSVCYTAGYYASVRPAAARSSLILNHRYLLDAMVDPKRYRYSGPQALLKMIWRVAPKPDLIFLLDAPAEVIQARKKEVPSAETARQRQEYQRVIGGLDNAYCVDTNRPLPVVADEVLNIVFDLMATRTEQRGRQ